MSPGYNGSIITLQDVNTTPLKSTIHKGGATTNQVFSQYRDNPYRLSADRESKGTKRLDDAPSSKNLQPKENNTNDTAFPWEKVTVGELETPEE